MIKRIKTFKLNDLASINGKEKTLSLSMPFLNSKDKRISQKASRKKKKKKSPTQDNRNQISLLPETTQPSQTKGTNKKQNM